MTTSPKEISSLLLPSPLLSHVPCRVQCTTLSTWLDKCTTRLTPYSIYFLTPRKCALFGVCCVALPRQVTYLIDEATDTGKGANSIVSMLQHFFKVHSLGECDVHLNADNCVEQNKNNTMLQYLMWCTMVGLHRRITLSFLIVGHTKFSPDWCFGLIKCQFQRTNVSLPTSPLSLTTVKHSTAGWDTGGRGSCANIRLGWNARASL